MGSILVRLRSMAGGNGSRWACSKVVQWGVHMGLDSGSLIGAPGGRWKVERRLSESKLSVGKPCAKFTVGSQVKEMELVADLETERGAQILLLKAAVCGQVVTNGRFVHGQQETSRPPNAFCFGAPCSPVTSKRGIFSSSHVSFCK